MQTRKAKIKTNNPFYGNHPRMLLKNVAPLKPIIQPANHWQNSQFHDQPFRKGLTPYDSPETANETKRINKVKRNRESEGRKRLLSSFSVRSRYVDELKGKRSPRLDESKNQRLRLNTAETRCKPHVRLPPLPKVDITTSKFGLNDEHPAVHTWGASRKTGNKTALISSPCIARELVNTARNRASQKFTSTESISGLQFGHSRFKIGHMTSKNEREGLLHQTLVGYRREHSLNSLLSKTIATPLHSQCYGRRGSIQNSHRASPSQQNVLLSKRTNRSETESSYYGNNLSPAPHSQLIFSSPQFKPNLVHNATSWNTTSQTVTKQTSVSSCELYDTQQHQSVRRSRDIFPHSRSSGSLGATKYCLVENLDGSLTVKPRIHKMNLPQQR